MCMCKDFLKFFWLICFAVLMGQPVYSHGAEIHEAVKRGDKEEVIRLIGQGANVNAIDERYETLFDIYIVN